MKMDTYSIYPVSFFVKTGRLYLPPVQKQHDRTTQPHQGKGKHGFVSRINGYLSYFSFLWAAAGDCECCRSCTGNPILGT